jgi:O-antigen/teichoic acid export membrane protein
MVGYAPSLIATALVSFASVSIFTSSMTQADYGQYALAINAMTMLISVSFYWLQGAASRLMPQAVEAGTESKLLATLYGSFLVCALMLLIVAAVLGAWFDWKDWRVAAWFAPPLAALRGLLNLNQAVHRNFFRITRYNIIEVGQACVGLIAAIVLVVLLRMGASGAAIGAMIGLGALSLFDWRMIGNITWRDFDKVAFKDIAHFGVPLIMMNGLGFVLSRSDSFLIEHFLGPDQVGVYAAGYAFPDRIGQNLFMAVATASFPLVVRRLQHEGIEAAREQTYSNGVAMLALAVPACVGLLLVNRQVAAALIGNNFRAGAVEIMPWITVATILNGIAIHYFDHAFHLAKKTQLFLFTLGPAALLNLVLNCYAIPHYGIMGAAYTTLASYALYLVLSIVVGRSVFRVRFPFKPALQIAISTALMALVLRAFTFPENMVGLAEMIVIGGAVYGAGLLAFNVMGLREASMARWKEKGWNSKF